MIKFVKPLCSLILCFTISSHLGAMPPSTPPRSNKVGNDVDVSPKFIGHSFSPATNRTRTLSDEGIGSVFKKVDRRRSGDPDRLKGAIGYSSAGVVNIAEVLEPCINIIGRINELRTLRDSRNFARSCGPIINEIKAVVYRLENENVSTVGVSAKILQRFEQSFQTYDDDAYGYDNVIQCTVGSWVYSQLASAATDLAATIKCEYHRPETLKNIVERLTVLIN